MVLILLIISLVGLAVFFTLKFKNKSFSSYESDIFFENRIFFLKKQGLFLLELLYDFPIFLKNLFKRIKIYLIRFYKVVAIRIFKKLKVNNKLKLNKNRGIVSIFLRTISEEKNKK